MDDAVLQFNFNFPGLIKISIVDCVNMGNTLQVQFEVILLFFFLPPTYVITSLCTISSIMDLTACVY